MFKLRKQKMRAFNFKGRLDGALSSLVEWKVSLPQAGGFELEGL